MWDVFGKQQPSSAVARAKASRRRDNSQTERSGGAPVDSPEKVAEASTGPAEPLTRAQRAARKAARQARRAAFQASPELPAAELLGHLRAGQVRAAEAILVRLASTSDILDGCFEELASLFASEGQGFTFLEFLMARPALSLGRLSLAFKVVSFAAAQGREQDVIDWIYSLKGPLQVRWSLHERVKRFRASPQINRALIYLKYLGLSSIETASDLVERAEKVSHAVDHPMHDITKLYESRTDKGMSVETWRQHFIVANCIDHLLVENTSATLRARMVSEEGKRKAFGQLPKPFLLVSFHGGFEPILREVFREQFPFPQTHVIGQAYIPGAGYVGARDDPRADLFGGLRALQEGKVVFIAPDGPSGNVNCEIDVLGTKTKIAEGAAFLAYEAKCDSAWFAMARDDTGFAPVLRLFPKREAKEPYRQFRQRFVDFFASCTTDFYTGDPRNLVVTTRWRHLFK